MNWRAMLLSGALAAGLGLTLVPRASADPPPWAGRWKHHEYYGNEGRRWDRSSWDRWHSNQSGWYRNGWDRSSYYRRTDPNSAQLMDRLRFDREKINEIAPTGRHRKALQWYKDDLQNARRALHGDYYSNR